MPREVLTDLDIASIKELASKGFKVDDIGYMLNIRIKEVYKVLYP